MNNKAIKRMTSFYSNMMGLIVGGGLFFLLCLSGGAPVTMYALCVVAFAVVKLSFAAILKKDFERATRKAANRKYGNARSGRGYNFAAVNANNDYMQSVNARLFSEQMDQAMRDATGIEFGGNNSDISLNPGMFQQEMNSHNFGGCNDFGGGFGGGFGGCGGFGGF